MSATLFPDGVAIADDAATLKWFRQELAAAEPAEPWAGCRDAIAALERSLAQPAAERPEPAPDHLVWQRHWRRQLHRLKGLPLLAVGAGDDRKAPANLRNGELLGSWQKTTHTPGQIQEAHRRICSAGTRTGRDAGGLLAIDIDGATAVSWLLEHGCDPLAAQTWQVHRSTGNARLKVCWRLTEEQQSLLGQIKTKVQTRDAMKDPEGKVIEKAEAVEVFHGTGQVVVLGHHPTSRGFYFWPEGQGPEALAPIPPSWWEAVLQITDPPAKGSSARGATASSRTTSKGDWRRLETCPICGRNERQFCSIHRDGKTIRCFHGSTFGPVQSHGLLKPGNEITDVQGTAWAFSREQRSAGESFSIFVAPDPKRRQQRFQAQVALAPAQGQAQLQADEAPPRPASFQSLIQQLPDGWDPNTIKPRHLSAGWLAEMLPAAALRFNEMDLRGEVHTNGGWQRITDADLDTAYVLLTGKGWKVGSEPVIKAILHTCRQAPHHPVREYLQQVEADPSIEPFNLDQVATRFFRAADPLHVAMVRAWLIGAVSRALKPGCQMDYVLVLKGAQGQRKSRSLEALASPDWYCSSIPENEKDLLLNIHSCWIYELAEVESVTSRKETGRLKNLITTSADMVRVPYGRTSERMPRQSVFGATCNEDTFLRDDTGSRRFWVVPVEGTEPLDRDGLMGARDAIWKAAVAAHRAGELPMLPPELERLSTQQNEEFNQQDPWAEMVRAWMDGDPMHRWDPDRDPSTLIYDPSQPFTSADVLYSAGLRRLDQITRADEMRVAAVLRQLGFRKGRQQRVDGRVTRLWELSQPSQPSQPRSAEVVTPQSPCAGTDLGLLSQPSQPQSSNRRLKKGAAEKAAPAAAASVSQGSFGKPPRGCDTSPESTAAQAVSLSQPHAAEVVTPPPSRVIPPNWPAWGDRLLSLRGEHPNASGHQLACLLAAQDAIYTNGAAVNQLLNGWDAAQQEVPA